MLAVNGHAKHKQSLCRVGYGKTALSMDLFFITTANILSNHTFLLVSRNFTLSPGKAICVHNKKKDSQGILESLSCRGDRIRTCDPLVPNQMRYQLRYTPKTSFFSIIQ